MVARTRQDSLLICPWSKESIVDPITTYGATVAQSIATAAYPAADMALYIPFFLFGRTVIKKLGWFNGSTASGNVDAGLYDVAGRRITSTGLTAQSGTNTMQSVDITDVALGAGMFYLAITMDNTTGTLFRGTLSATTDLLVLLGMAQQQLGAGAALPTTFTLARIAQNFIPAVAAFGRTLA